MAASRRILSTVCGRFLDCGSVNNAAVQQIRWRSKKFVLAAEERAKEGLEPLEEWAFNHVERKNGLFKPKHTVEEQIAYMNSEVYQRTYQGRPIYHWYRRNIRGQAIFQPPPRLFCIDKHGRFNLNHACPVCRDEYLFFDYRNPKLIQQFLRVGTDQPINIRVSGLCREQYINLKAQLTKAKEHGTIAFAVEFRQFNYKSWYPNYEETAEDIEMEMNKVSRNDLNVEEIHSDPSVLFPIHKRDVGTSWDQWWLRHDKFAQKDKVTRNT